MQLYYIPKCVVYKLAQPIAFASDVIADSYKYTITCLCTAWAWLLFTSLNMHRIDKRVKNKFQVTARQKRYFVHCKPANLYSQNHDRVRFELGVSSRSKLNTPTALSLDHPYKPWYQNLFSSSGDVNFRWAD